MFTTERLENILHSTSNSDLMVSSLHILKEQVDKNNKYLNPNKACGQDNVHPKVIDLCDI